MKKYFQRTQSLEWMLLVILFLPSFIYYGNFILSLLGVNGYFSYLYGILTLFSTYIWISGLFKKNGAKVALLLLITLILILSAFIIHGNGRYIIGTNGLSLHSFLVSDLGNFYNLVLPILVLYFNGADLGCVFTKSISLSRLLIILQLVTYYLTIRTGAFSVLAGDYMSFAYYGLLPMMALFVNKDKSFLNLVFFIIGAFSILIIGCRGALVTSLVFVLSYYLFKAIIEEKRYKFIIFLSVIILFIIYGIDLLVLINNQLERVGFSSRTLVAIMSGSDSFVDSSGRDELSLIAFQNIKLLPDGLWGDRQYFDVYIHNWILEILLDAGLFIGLLIIIYILYIMLNSIIRTIHSKSIIDVAMLCYCLSMLGVKFLVSSSFLVDPGFLLSVLMLLQISRSGDKNYFISSSI